MANKVNFEVGLSMNQTQYNQLKKQLTDLSNITKQDLTALNPSLNDKEISQQLNAIKKRANEVKTALVSAFNVDLKTVNISKFNTALKKLDINKIYRDFQAAGIAGQSAFRGITSQVLTTNLQLKETHKTLDKMAETMGNTIKWGVTSRIFNSMAGAVQDAWTFTKELDTSLNNIRIVTGKSADEMERFAKVANKTAQTLGKSTKDYTDAALIFYQQGLNDVESQQRAEITLKAANVTGQSTDTVSEQLTAVWNGYKVAIEDSEKYVDKLAAVAADTAADLEELSTGMSKVASAANIMGVDIDQLSATLATVISVTRQAPESVGTAFKTIYARMGDIQAGIDTETSLDAYTQDMKDIGGINVLDANNELRDMGEVIEEVGEKWSSMTREQQVALSQVMAGTRQYNNLLSLFDNWDMYTDALETSKGSLGELNKQQEIYMQSTEAHLEQLGTAWERVFDSFVDNDGINGLIDVFTGLTNGVANFTEALGGGGNALLFIGNVMTKVFSKQISQSLNTTVENFQKAKHNAEQLKKSIADIENLKNTQGYSDNVVRQMVDAKEQMSQYYGLLDKQGIEQGDSLIREMGRVEDLAEQWETTKQTVDAYMNSLAQANRSNGVSGIQDLDSNSARFERMQMLLTGVEQSLDRSKGAWADYDKEMKKASRNGDELASTMEDIVIASESLTTGTGLSKTLTEDIKKATKELEEFKEKNKNWDALVTGNFETSTVAGRKFSKIISNLRMVMQQGYDELSQKTKQTRQVQEDEFNSIITKTDEYKQAIEEAKAKWGEFIKPLEQTSAIENIVKITQSVGTLASSLMTIKNMGNIWSDESLSGGEKVLQTIMALSTLAMQVGPMLISMYKGLAAQKELNNLLDAAGLAVQGKVTTAKITDLIVEKNLDKAKKQGLITNKATLATLTAEQKAHILNAFATDAEKNALFGAKAAQDAFNSSALLNPYLWIAVAVIAAIAGIAFAVKAAADEQNKYNQAVIDAEARVTELTEKYKELKTEYEDLKSSIEDYDGMVKALSVITKGTDEWYAKVAEINDKVLELMANYPSLVKYMTQSEDGVLGISEEGYKQLAKQLQARAISMNVSTQFAQQDLYRAQMDASVDNFRKDNNFMTTGTTRERMINGNYYDKVTSREELNSGLERITSLIASNQGGFLAGELDDEILAIGKELGVNDMTTALDKNRENLLNLSNSLSGYQSSIDTYSNTIIGILGANNPAYQNSDNKDLINQNVEKEVTDNYTEAREKVENMNNEELAQYWINNLAPDDVQTVNYKKHRFFNEDSTLTYNQDGEEKVVDLDTLEQQIASHMAEQQTQQDITKASYSTDSVVDMLNADTAGLGTYMKDVATGKDTTQTYTKEQIEHYKLAWQEWLNAANDTEKQAIADFMGNTESLTASVENAFNNGKTRDEIAKIHQQSFNPKASGYNDSAVAVGAGIQSGDITYENAKDNEDFQNLISSLDELKKAYPEVEAAANMLNNTWLIGTQEYNEALEEVQDKLYKAKMADLLKQEDELITQLQENLDGADWSTEIALDDEQFQKDMDALLNKEYAINLAIHSEAEQEFDSIVAAMNNMNDQASKIGDNFVVAADDIRELNNAFPGIIQGMEDLGNGTVQLNEEVVQSAIGMAQAEIAADSEATIAKLQNQATILRQKQTVYQNMANAAFELAQMEVTTDDTAADQKAIISENLAKLKSLNDELETQNEMDNDQAVADASNANGEVVAKNWNSAYQSSAKSSYQFAVAAIQNMKAAAGEGSPTMGDFGVSYSGSTGVSSEASTIEGTQSLLEDTSGTNQNEWAKIGQKYQMLADQSGAAANDIEGMIAGIGAKNVESLKSLNGIKSGLGSDGKKDGGGKDPDKMDHLDDEPDRYHEVNTQLDKISNHLDKIQSQEKKLVGAELIANINAQLGQLDNRLDQLREKVKIAEGEAAELKGGLAGQGVTFNPDGTISNYEQIYNEKLAYVNSIIDAYNGMSAEEQEAYKEVVEQAKQDFEQFTTDLDRYDELVSDFIPGLQNDIQDAIDEEIELNIKKFNLEFDVRLNMKDATKDWNEFKKRILDGIDEDDIYGNAKARATDDFSNMIGENGVQASTKQAQEVLAELKEMDETGWSDVYGDDRATALEDLKTAYETINEDLMEIDQIQKDVYQAWLDTMDEINDKMADQVAMYEQVSNLIDHDMKVIELIYGATDYEALGKYYDKQHQNNLGLLDFQRQNADFWEQEMNSIDKEKDPDAWKKARDNWISAVNDLNATVEASIENARAKMENTIDEVFQKFNNEITDGKGLDYLAQQWDLVNDNADDYLDTVNAAFGIRQLENKYQDAIDLTDNISAQRKLNDLMESELKALREKDKLTEYDIERANMKYEIALKQIALEEAQQTKTTMRLRRDSQGNYRYEYVADEDAISKLQDELDILENSLYNFDKERWIEMQNQVVDAVQERQDAIKEILMDASLSEEERAERLAEINRLYNEKIQNITDQTVTAQENLYESGADEIAKIWDEQGKDFQALSDEEQRILVEEMLPQFETGVNEMIDKFSGPGGFEDMTVSSMDNLKEATDQYNQELEEIEYNAGISFDKVEEGIDKNIPKTQELIEDNDELNQEYQEQIEKIKELNEELAEQAEKYKKIAEEAKKATQEAYNYWYEQQRQAAEAAEQEKKNSDGVQNPNEDNNTPKDNKTTTPDKGHSGSSSRTLNNATMEGIAAAIWMVGSGPSGWGTGKTRSNNFSAKFGSDGASKIQDYINSHGPNNSIFKSWNSRRGELANYYLDAFGTGGYTGDWVGNYGKLAMLHSKELVLNAHDTENMLNMMQIARDVIASAGPRVGTLSAGRGAAAATTHLEQDVHIEANFPNVESASEIEEALNNLVQLASQRATRNTRG